MEAERRQCRDMISFLLLNNKNKTLIEILKFISKTRKNACLCDSMASFGHFDGTQWKRFLFEMNVWAEGQFSFRMNM